MTRTGAEAHLSWFDVLGAFPDTGQTAKAMHLMADKVRQGDRVLMALPNGPDFLSILFGTWRLGAEAVIVDAAAEQDAINAARISRPKVAWVDPGMQSRLADVLPGLTLPDPGCLQNLECGPAPFPSDIARRPGPGRFILFTSGSAGLPRGVLTSVADLKPEIDFLKNLLGYGPDTRVASLVPWSHAYGMIVGLLAPIASGAALVQAHADFPSAMIEAFDKSRADWVLATPAQLGPLARLASKRALSAPPGVVSSGAPLPARVGRTWREDIGADLIEIYGSTETGGMAWRRKAGPFLPFPFVAWRLDRGPDTPSELVVRSPTIARNALAHDGALVDLTDGEGWYATADVAEASGDGFILLGRNDRIVKIGGKRVSLAEVENAIMDTGLAETAQAWLSKRAGRGDGEVWVAVTPETADVPGITRRIAKVLPSFRRPRRIVAMREIPSRRPGKPLPAEAIAIIEQAWKKKKTRSEP